MKGLLMQKCSILFALMVIVSIVITATAFGQDSLQFKQPIEFSVGVAYKVDTLWVGINSGTSTIPASTYGQDLGTNMGATGAWKELQYPSFPMSYSFVPYFIEIPSRIATPTVWNSSKIRPYDFRGYTSSSQVDTFQIEVVTGDSLADGFPSSGLKFAWRNTLIKKATTWQLLRKTKTTAPVVYTELIANMATSGTSFYDSIAIGSPAVSIVTKNKATYLLIKTGAFNDTTPVGVRDYVNLNPGKFELEQNYPNPFNPTTEFKFTVAKKGRATLQVFNTLGQEVMNLFDGTAEPGRSYQVTLDGSRLASGVYFYRLTSVEGSAIKKMVLLK
jgi:hypothetical protein